MTPNIHTIIRQHVSLEVRCLDRLYLHAYMPKLQTSGGLCYFLHDHLGYPVPSPALLKPRHDRFVAAVQACAATQRLEVVPYVVGDVKTQSSDRTVRLTPENAELLRGLLELRPDAITHVVNSHFHFDHCGGNEFFPGATFLVQRREMEAARDPAVLAQQRYFPSFQDFDHRLDYHLVDGEHDVFDDGTVVLLPTYGHTPGHQSLRVRAGKGTDWVLAADACYTRENMDRDLLPGVLWDAAEMAHSLVRLRELRDRHGVTVIYGHDPAQWQELRHAPEPLGRG